MGDSLMAVFGVPLAHDDDAERAVAAGLAMRDVTGDLAFSIGVNSGELTATTVAGEQGTTVIGDVVNVAARLEKVAGPGEVLCGSLTAELAGRRVEFREREPVLLKGKAQPVEVYEAVSLRTRDGTAAGDVRLIGRDEELAFLRAQWRRMRRDRRARFVLLCGEAGSGKTRLVDELTALCAGDGIVVRTEYPGYGAMGGAHVAAEIVRQLGPTRDRAVEARLRSIGGELDPSLQTIEPTALRQEQTWAFGRLLQERAAEAPVLVVVDDLHRGGARTLEMLADLSTRLGEVPLLAVLAGRTEPGDWLTRFPAATTIRLSPLDRANAASLAGEFVRDKPLSPQAAEFFVERAGGNPLYLRELVAMARARGALVDEGGRYGLVAHAAIPASLQALLAARLDALPARQKQVLQYVAVLGEGADAERVARLGDGDAAASLRALADEGLVQEREDGRFVTVDPLLREVAYETLPRNVRGELHRRAASLARDSDERARHLDRAAKYLADDEQAAAETAEALAAAAEELIAVSRHLDALPLLERAAAVGPLRAASLLALAGIQGITGREEEALQTLARIPDDPGHPELAAERDHTAANTMTFRDPAWAAPRLEAAAERWHALGNPEKEAWARANAGVAWFNLSRMEEAAVHLAAGLALFERVGDRWGAVNTASFLALVTPTDPRVPQWLSDALELADAAGDRSRQLGALTTLMWHYFFRSFCGMPEETAEAEGFARRVAEIGEDVGAVDVAVHGRALLAIMARSTGRLDEAVSQVDAVQRLSGRLRHAEPWLGWAASFSLTVARGTASAAPPYPPEELQDPVASVAKLIVDTELMLAGRGHEVLARRPPESGNQLPFGEMAGLLAAVTLHLGGRSGEAAPKARLAAGAARALGARAAEVAALALLAEIEGDLAGLPPLTAIGAGETGIARSIGEMLVLRAYAAAGDVEAADRLRRSAEAMAMPGLAAEVPCVSPAAPAR
jgi:hypothetical protein